MVPRREGGRDGENMTVVWSYILPSHKAGQKQTNTDETQPESNPLTIVKTIVHHFCHLHKHERNSSQEEDDAAKRTCKVRNRHKDSGH